jgi:chloramphenicol 3-O-phosphotransferase
MPGKIILLNGASSAGKSTLAGSLQAALAEPFCPLEELERRELARGDRRIGEARVDFHTAHAFCTYDLEVDSTQAVEANVRAVISAWASRQRPSAFDRMSGLVAGPCVKAQSSAPPPRPPSAS